MLANTNKLLGKYEGVDGLKPVIIVKPAIVLPAPPKEETLD